MNIALQIIGWGLVFWAAWYIMYGWPDDRKCLYCRSNDVECDGSCDTWVPAHECEICGKPYKRGCEDADCECF